MYSRLEIRPLRYIDCNQGLKNIACEEAAIFVVKLYFLPIQLQKTSINKRGNFSVEFFLFCSSWQNIFNQILFIFKNQIFCDVDEFYCLHLLLGNSKSNPFLTLLCRTKIMRRSNFEVGFSLCKIFGLDRI